jgi:TPR repeat protein
MHASAPVEPIIKQDVEKLRSSLLKLFGKGHPLDILERASSRAPERALHNGITIRNGRIFVYLLDFLPADLPYGSDKPANTKDGKIVPATFLLENLGWNASFVNGTLIIDVRSLFNIDYVLRDDRALNLLAFLFTISGILKSNNEEKVAAVNVLQYAAAQDNPCAKLNLGRCLERGIGLRRDYPNAVQFYRQVADEADRYGRVADGASVPFCGVYASAQYHYGRCLYSGIGVPNNDAQAVTYLKLSAENGNPMGQYFYGYCLEQGIGIERNPEEAVQYYRLSADQGHAGGQCNYGLCLRSGIGIKQNLAEAVKYYKLSADQGYALGQCCYGICLEYRIGIAKDEGEAVKYYRLSANQGNTEAQRRLEGLERELSARQAVTYRKLSAAQGHAGAQRRLS